MAASSTLANNKFMKKQLADMKQKQRDIEYTLRADEKKRDKLNVSEFRTLLRKKNSTNDLRYFRRHMTSAEQQKVIADLKEIHAVSIIEKPYRLSLLETNIPIAFKAIAMRKINSLRHMEPGCGEYYKVKNWVDTFMKIPFNKTKNLPLTIDDGLARCSEFMEASKTTLDTAVYGLNDAKLQIMQMVGQWISNPSAMGSAIAIKGPMGTGKTSLVKEGISKILGRDFAFIALGGATDSSFLEGHSYTYEGSTWGKIVEIIIQCGSMNPVIYFDELDKISDTAKGEEIVGILTHLTDTSQNSQFHDRYFAEIDFDLSKCLFIFSYNDESKVNPILLDRMYRINTTGYNKKDKTQIAQKYLIPKICEEVGFRQGDIVIPDSVIEHIVENYTEKEEGVRNLKRCLEVIHRKLNLYRLIKPDTPLFEKEMSLKVAFPFSVTSEVVDKLVKQANDDKRANLSLYL
jgi:ATP-dependent Lon protease